MSAIQPQSIRLEILTQLYGIRPCSRDAAQIVKLAQRENGAAFAELNDFLVRREAKYLEGQGHVAEVEGVGRWSITSAGIGWMEKQGLV